jgi:hypothetical protein
MRLWFNAPVMHRFQHFSFFGFFHFLCLLAEGTG